MLDCGGRVSLVSHASFSMRNFDQIGPYECGDGAAGSERLWDCGSLSGCLLLDCGLVSSLVDS